MMPHTFTDWESSAIIRALKVREAVERDMQEELDRFAQNEDMTDLMAMQAYREIRSAYMALLMKLEK